MSAPAPPSARRRKTAACGGLGASGLGHGRDALLQFLQMNAAAFPDMCLEPLEVVAEDDLLAARVRITGTHQAEFRASPSGKPVELEQCDFVRFEGDGKAVRHWRYVDSLALMQQLGAVQGP